MRRLWPHGTKIKIFGGQGHRMKLGIVWQVWIHSLTNEMPPMKHELVRFRLDDTSYLNFRNLGITLQGQPRSKVNAKF